MDEYCGDGRERRKGNGRMLERMKEILEKIEEILDEKSDRWITIYKWLTVVGAIILLIYFPFAAKETVETTNYWTGRTYTEEIYNWEFLFMGWALTITSFFLVMLLLNALRNLQMMREKICSEPERYNSSDVMTPAFMNTANANEPSYKSAIEFIKGKKYEQALAQLAALDDSLYVSIRTLLEDGEEETAIMILESIL